MSEPSSSSNSASSSSSSSSSAAVDPPLHENEADTFVLLTSSNDAACHAVCETFNRISPLQMVVLLYIFVGSIILMVLGATIPPSKTTRNIMVEIGMALLLFFLLFVFCILDSHHPFRRAVNQTLTVCVYNSHWKRRLAIFLFVLSAIVASIMALVLTIILINTPSLKKNRNFVRGLSFSWVYAFISLIPLGALRRLVLFFRAL